MLDGLGAAWRGLRNVHVAGYSYIWANVAFVALSLPIITFPAALSALFRVSLAAHTEPADADLSLFWETFRGHLVKALPWGVLNALFAGVNFFNLASYSAADGVGVMGLRAVWLLAGFVWLGMFLYTWPIYHMMTRPTLSGAARNALLMVLQNPLFTLAVLTVILAVSLLSTILVAAWLLLTWGAIASIASAAVLNRLAQVSPAYDGNG